MRDTRPTAHTVAFESFICYSLTKQGIAVFSTPLSLMLYFAGRSTGLQMVRYMQLENILPTFVKRVIYEGNSISKLQIQVATHVFELSAGNCHR
jgi:hypothetical protein